MQLCHGVDDGVCVQARGTGGVITATASQAIVTKWLLPWLGDFATRHPDFAARHPDIVVRLDVTNRIVDLVHGEADIGIRFGAGLWQGLDATHLGDEQIIAVLAPALLPGSGVVDFDWLNS